MERAFVADVGCVHLGCGTLSDMSVENAPYLWVRC